MAFIQLEDLTQEAEIILFPRLFAQVENWLDEYSIFMVKGVLDLTSSGNVKIKANQLIPLELLFEEWPKIHNVTIKIPENSNADHIKNLKELPDGKTPIDIIFKENEKFIKLKSKKKVKLSFEQLDKLKEIGIRGKIAL